MWFFTDLYQSSKPLNLYRNFKIHVLYNTTIKLFSVYLLQMDNLKYRKSKHTCFFITCLSRMYLVMHGLAFKVESEWQMRLFTACGTCACNRDWGEACVLWVERKRKLVSHRSRCQRYLLSPIVSWSGCPQTLTEQTACREAAWGLGQAGSGPWHGADTCRKWPVSQCNIRTLWGPGIGGRQSWLVCRRYRGMSPNPT